MGNRGALVKATLKGKVIAASDDIVDEGGYAYFPNEHVRLELLEKAPKTASDLECPHGVQFYDVVADGGESRRAAWSYLAPRATMEQVDHWIGFRRDVRVEP